VNRVESFSAGVEVDSEGYRLAWCFELPGCASLVLPGQDPHERLSLAILEFMAWRHERSADRLVVEPGAVQLVETVHAPVPLGTGETEAFFHHDSLAAGGREFPAWANAHDRALDEFRDLALSLPPALLANALGGSGRTPSQVIEHAATAEQWFAGRLSAQPAEVRVKLDPRMHFLEDAHRHLQQVVCDVPPATLQRHPASQADLLEEWSVRKVMRRSTWHLRYHTAELRRAIGSFWLG